MNKHDRDNLNFLLSADKETMENWYRTVSDDDIAYALELMQAHKTELIMQELEVIDTEAEEDLSDAQAILAYYTQK